MATQESGSFAVKGHISFMLRRVIAVNHRGAAVQQHCICPQGERRLWSCGGEAAAHGPSRSSRHLL